MENASKALIIAGAILLSILIIGLGMFIFQQAQGVMGQVNMDKQAMDVYNAEFEQYEGTRSGTSAKKLCDLIRNHNNGSVDDPSRQVQLTNTGTPATTPAEEIIPATTINTIKTAIRAGKTYTVTIGYDAKSGYVVGVDISEKK